jgi:CBS-domain-containing membrane protein
MSRVVPLPRDAWHEAGGLAEARFAAPEAGRLVVWAEGLAEGAVLHAPCGEATAFAALGGTGFAGTVAEAGEGFRITAAAPPRRCLVLLRRAGRPSATLGAGFPRAVARPPRRAAPGTAATRARMDAALAAQDLDAALAALAELLLLAREEAATPEAARALLAHLARHPLCRGPALGALAAALTEARA